MLDRTNRFSLPYILPNQAQKHVTHNEAIRTIDLLVHGSIFSEASEPPPAPSEGDCHLVAIDATGDFLGHDSDLAAFVDGVWLFLPAREGMRLWNSATGRIVIRAGGDWLDIADALALVALADFEDGTVKQLGVNTAPDPVNRFAVKADAALLSHDDITPGSGDMRLILNKSGVSATASVVFQTGWSGRAEFGLGGEDNWSMKVSPDGADWQTAWTVDCVTGQVTVGRQFNLDDANLSINGSTWRINQISVAADNAWGQYKGRRARGTPEMPAAVQASDTIFSFTPEAFDGITYVQCGGFSYIAQTDFDTSKNAAFRIATLDNGNWYEALRIRADGNTGIDSMLR